MGKNLTRKSFSGVGSWTAPAGVTQVRVITLGRYYPQIAGALYCGSFTAINIPGDIYAWGQNADGQLGTGNLTDYSSPVVTVGGNKFASLALAFYGVGVASGGVAYAWGANNYGQLGTGTVTSTSSPVVVLGSRKYRQAAVDVNGASYLLDVDGNAYAFGNNNFGQLGDGTVVAKSSPVLVLGGLKFKYITAGVGTAYGITTSGDMYAWGRNLNGAIGDGVSPGTTAAYSSPILVLGGLKFQSVAAGGSVGLANFALALTTDNKIYGWGSNNYNQLGSGAPAATSSPVLLVGGQKWRYVTAGNYDGLGITVDGDAYGWGRNNAGELGTGNTSSYASPVAVIGGYKFRQIATGVTPPNLPATLGLSVDGKLYAWGYNANGQLGDGTTVSKSSPVLVLGTNSYRSIDRIVLNEQVIDVTPGSSYNVNTMGAVSYFGPTGVFADADMSGATPTEIILEYQA